MSGRGALGVRSIQYSAGHVSFSIVTSRSDCRRVVGPACVCRVRPPTRASRLHVRTHASASRLAREVSRACHAAAGAAPCAYLMSACEVKVVRVSVCTRYQNTKCTSSRNRKKQVTFLCRLFHRRCVEVCACSAGAVGSFSNKPLSPKIEGITQGDLRAAAPRTHGGRAGASTDHRRRCR